MTFVVQGDIRVDAGQAKAEVKALGSAQNELKGSNKALSAQGRKAAAETKKLGRAAASAAGSVDLLSDAERAAAREAATLSNSHRTAAGQVGNLTAQFNDIGVMMAAGQSPLQLAIQQGTQITQVIGPMGATGAAKALGGALLGMINPVSLITIGSIAAGAAMVQWLTGAGEEAETLEDRIGGIIERTKALRDISSESLDDLAGRYGLVTEAVIGLHAETKTLLEQDLARQAADVGEAVKQLLHQPLRTRTAVFEDLFGSKGKYADRRAAFLEMGKMIDDLGSATGISEQLELIERLQAGVKALAGDFTQMTQKQLAFYQGLRDAEDALRRIQAVQNDGQSEQLAFFDMSIAKAVEEQLAAEDMLEVLRKENTLRYAMAKFGAESIEVEALKQDAARRSLEARLDEMDVAEDLKDKILGAFEQGQALADLNMAKGINSAAVAAQTLADQLGISLGIARQVVAATGEVGGVGGDPTLTGFEANDPRSGNKIWTGGYSTRWNPKKPKTGGGGGGSVTIDKERAALERLIAQEQLQLELLRETDPVQQEMLRHREALAGATDQERASLEALITERIREKDALAQATEQSEFFKTTAYGAFEDLILQGDSLSDVFDNLGKAIARAALEAALLGSGPLAGLFGGGGGGGILGTIVDAVFPAGGNSAALPAAGALPIAAAPRPPQTSAALPAAGAGASGAAGAMTLRVLPSPQFNVEMEQVAQNVSAEVVREYDATVAPSTVQRVIDDPRRIG